MMTRKETLISIAIVAIVAISLVVLKTVPLIPVTEEYGPQEFTLHGGEHAITTLTTKEGWTVSGSYSASNNKEIDFLILKNFVNIENVEEKDVVYVKTHSVSGTFNFIAQGEIYTVLIAFSGYSSEIAVVTFEAKQTGKTTI